MLNRTRYAALIALVCSSAHAAIPVEVQALGERLIDNEVRAPAVVVAANQAVITSQVTAIIDAIEADVGTAVRAGDVLVRLDDDDASLALEQAQASLAALKAQIEQAEQLLARGEELFQRNFISDDDLLERRTTLSVLQANHVAQRVAVRSAQLKLARTRILAPYDATVIARQAQVGALAMPGTALVTLVQTDNREVEGDLDPRYSGNLDSASAMRFVTRGREWPIRVLRLSSVIDRGSRIQKGRFGFVGNVAPIGSTGEIVWTDAAGLVPVSLIVQRDERLGVFVANGTQARFVPLPDAQQGRPAPADLSPDTLLVVRGQSRLQDGDELTITRQ